MALSKLIATALASLLSFAFTHAGTPQTSETELRILLLGGTQFLGRHIVEQGLERGHHFTLFNRGRSNAELFDGLVDKRVGDRSGDFEALSEGEWDVVIDTSGHFPTAVGELARYLDGRAKQYIYISSVSVYDDLSQQRLGETARLETIKKGQDPDIDNPASYGARKALCERAISSNFSGKVLHIRPGLIVGPYDQMGRVAYWIDRVADGGDILVPRSLEQPLQLIDVRDLSSWILDMAQSKVAGTFNAVGPQYPITLGDFLKTCQPLGLGAVNWTVADENFLLEQGLNFWEDFPLWLPKELEGLFRVDASKAHARGLEHRPLIATAADTLAWLSTDEGQELARKRFPTRAFEQDLLQRWDAQKDAYHAMVE